MLAFLRFLKRSSRPLASGLFLLILLVTPATGSEGDPAWWMSGTWSAGRDVDHDPWWISLRSESPNGGRHEHSWRLDGQGIEGLDLKSLGGNRHPVDFRIRRDAGSILAHGEFSGIRGAGTFELELDPAFPVALDNRGVGRPTPGQHARLLLANVSLSFLDTLAREKYPTPRVEMLVKMTEHGVTEAFVTGLAKAGYRLESLDGLVRAVDHGVNGQFVREMALLGFPDLDFEMLMRARDHGVTAGFVAGLEEVGVQGLSLEETIHARDHGVDAGYIQSLRSAGFDGLTLEDAVRARDHGVTSAYARRMREKRPDATLSDVIAWRDRGVQP